jgi:hypothetical protein
MTVEDPELVARMVEGVTALRETVKVGTTTTIIVTETVVVLESVFGAVPVIPVTGTLNPGAGCPAVQETERTAPENEAVQSAGTAPAENVTVPANPLTGVTVQVEVPALPTGVEIAGQPIEKSTTWKVTGGVDVTVCVGVPPVPVTVAV